MTRERLSMLLGVLMIVVSVVAAVFLAPRAAPPPVAGTPPRDESLTTADYLLLGMPAPDRVWMSAEVVKAHEVLARVVEARGYQALPRRGSPRSGAVFSRLTDLQGMARYGDASMPLDLRVTMALDQMNALNRILKLYLPAFMQGKVGDSDLLELEGVELRYVVVLLGLVDELRPTIPRDAPDYDRRMNGFVQVQQGMAGIVNGGLMTLTDRQSVRPGELVKLIGTMQETLPKIVPRLQPASRTEIVVRLKAMSADPALAHLQPALGQLEAAVRARVESQSLGAPATVPTAPTATTG